MNCAVQHGNPSLAHRVRDPAGGSAAQCVALPDLPHHRVHVRVVPDLGELVVFDAIKRELRDRHPTTSRLDSLEGPLLGTGDPEVHRNITAAGSIATSFTLMVDV
jgi:hypothetical protein